MNIIEQLPKVELHLHIEGTFEPELMFKIAARNGVKLPYHGIDEVKKAYQFSNLQDFLNIYYAATNCLLHEQDFYDLTWAYLQKMAHQHVKHVEIFFDPQTHTNRGISFEVVVNGIYNAMQAAKKTFGITSFLIACFLRDLTEKSAFETFEKILDHKDKILAIGLDSAEVNNPPIKFKSVFIEAKKRGFRTVAHAGEEGPPEYIWQALQELEVDRIDHGIRCVEDANLVKYLVEQQVPLTVCPLSNVKLQVVPSLTQHPLAKMLYQGLCVTINSDDPAYFGGYINENFYASKDALALSSADIKQLVKNSINASFMPVSEKNKLLLEC